jgi:hypothetical protein
MRCTTCLCCFFKIQRVSSPYRHGKSSTMGPAYVILGSPRTARIASKCINTSHEQGARDLCANSLGLSCKISPQTALSVFVPNHRQM